MYTLRRQGNEVGAQKDISETVKKAAFAANPALIEFLVTLNVPKLGHSLCSVLATSVEDATWCTTKMWPNANVEMIIAAIPKVL